MEKEQVHKALDAIENILESTATADCYGEPNVTGYEAAINAICKDCDDLSNFVGLLRARYPEFNKIVKEWIVNNRGSYLFGDEDPNRREAETRETEKVN